MVTASTKQSMSFIMEKINTHHLLRDWSRIRTLLGHTRESFRMLTKKKDTRSPTQVPINLTSWSLMVEKSIINWHKRTL